MKKYQTHSVTQVEELLYDYADRIRNAEGNAEKKKLLKIIKGYEKQFNNVSDKHINGKEYPNRMYHSDNKLMDRETIEKLINSVPSMDNSWNETSVRLYRKQYHCNVLENKK